MTQCKQYRMGFCVFFNNKNLFLFKKTKDGLKNKKKTVRVVCFQKNGFSQPWLRYLSIFLWFSFDRTICRKSRHYQFNWVCPALQQYRSLVL